MRIFKKLILVLAALAVTLSSQIWILNQNYNNQTARAAGTVVVNSQMPGGAALHIPSQASPWTWSFTNTSGTVLYAFLDMNISPAASVAVTYGGASMVFLGSRGAGNNANGNIGLFRLLNPPTGANNFSVTWSTGATAVLGAAISFTGNDPVNPDSGTASVNDDQGNFSGNFSVTVPGTTSGNYVIAAFAYGDSVGNTPGGTESFKFDGDNSAYTNNFEGQYQQSAGGSVAMTYHSNNGATSFAAVGIEVKASAVADVQAPSTPTNLSATAVSSSAINLSWTASTDNIGVTGYKVYRGGVQVGTSNTNSYSDTGLTSSTLYSYTVAAYDASGNNSSQSSSASATTQTPPPPDTTPPSTPTGLSANAVSSSQINLSWTASTDNIGVTGYKIFRGGTQITTSNTNSYSDVGLTGSTAYSYTVSAYDAAGNNSSQSSSAGATTQAAGVYPWSGVLAPARATDWSGAGVVGGIPSRTTICANISASDTTAAIQTKLNACPAGQVALFAAGTYNLTASIYSNKGIVLRGAGPTQTTINLGSGTNIFMGDNGQGGEGSYISDSPASTNWTGGLTKGSTVLTVASTAGLAANQRVVLDQHNAPYVFTDGVENGVGGHCYPGNSCGRNDAAGVYGTTGMWFGSDNRAQMEMVQIQSIDSPTQITIKGPGVSHDYSASLVPQIFYWNTSAGGNVQYSGVENMKINANYNDFAIAMPGCDNCWVKNVTMTNIARSGVFFWWGFHDEVRDSYFSSDNAACGPTHYGIEVLESTFTKVENNIFYGVCSNILIEGSYGAVLSYNYTLNTAHDNEFAAIDTHLAYNYMQLWEGNITSGFGYDNSWGTAGMMTAFRNYASGNAPNKTNYRIPFQIDAHNDYMNLVANVLGDTTYHTVYVCDQAHPFVTDNYIYDLGYFDSCEAGISTAYPFDSTVESSLVRWGNWDAATYKANGNTNGVRFCTGSGAGNSACTASETASADPTFPGLASPSTTFAASYYLSSKPSWFGSVPWPPIGPDVNCVTNCVTTAASHANMIPAELCYQNGAKDANGFLTAFDASICYTSGGGGPDTTAPSTPTGLSATAISSSGINLTWTASTDNVGVTGYKIFRGGVQVGTSATNSYSDTGLTAGTLYSYTVSANDAAGNNSSQSSSAVATTQSAPDTTAPTVPTGLNAVVASSTAVNLTWTASSDPTIAGQTTSGLAGYKIYRNGSQVGISSTTHYTDLNLFSSTTYTYTVLAYDNSNNQSSQSTSVQVTTTNGTPLPGDINLDHIVNSLDYSAMNSHWFQNFSSADLNSDSIVNSLDFAILKNNWGRTW